jgi:anaerobic selenocysteine-containing dehydrogenase
VRVLDQSRIGPILCGDPRDLGEGPPVTALLVQNTNPLMVAPETNKVRQGFARDDLFACVHEQFLTETAAMADIVLPATTFLEHDDLYTASGHNTLQVVRKAIEPLDDARSNHFVICALAKRLGAEHPGFEMSAWEMIGATLEASGLPDAETLHAAQWWDCAPSNDEMHFRNGFPHADGRFHFKPDWARAGSDHQGLPRLPGHHDVIDAADRERPFRLVTAPARNYLNSSFTETPTSRAREGRPTVKIHPQACARLGVADGDRLRLGNARGTVVVHAEVFDGVQPEVVVVESLWPNAAFEEGIGINALTSAEPGRPRGGAVFHDTAIWIRPA